MLVRVLRTNGEMDDGWMPFDEQVDADGQSFTRVFKYGEDGARMVKWVPTDDLNAWQERGESSATVAENLRHGMGSAAASEAVISIPIDALSPGDEIKHLEAELEKMGKEEGREVGILMFQFAAAIHDYEVGGVMGQLSPANRGKALEYRKLFLQLQDARKKLLDKQ